VVHVFFFFFFFCSRKLSTSAEQYSLPDSEVRVIHGMPELRVSQKVRLRVREGSGEERKEERREEGTEK